jgi:hypothetical protein
MLSNRAAAAAAAAEEEEGGEGLLVDGEGECSINNGADRKAGEGTSGSGGEACKMKGITVEVEMMERPAEVCRALVGW